VDMSIIIEGGEDSFGSFEEVDEEMFEAMEWGEAQELEAKDSDYTRWIQWEILAKAPHSCVQVLGFYIGKFHGLVLHTIFYI
jgi:hypothetical protein